MVIYSLILSVFSIIIRCDFYTYIDYLFLGSLLIAIFVNPVSKTN